MRQLGDVDAPEQAERGEPLLALDARRVAERLARLERQLPLNRGGARPPVADDDHVIDQHLRTFADAEEDVGARVALGEHHARIDSDALVAAVAVLEVDAIAIGGDIDLRVRLAGHGRERSANLLGGEHDVPHHVDGADERARPFADVDADLDVTIRCG